MTSRTVSACFRDSANVLRLLTARCWCRVENLDEDMAGLIDLLNQKRDPKLPEIENKLQWKNCGLGGSTVCTLKPEKRKDSRHTRAFIKCGEKCMHGINTYYAQDFAALGYPTELSQIQADESSA